MKVRSVKVSKEMELALRVRAREKGVTDSFVVREALAEYLAAPTDGSAKARQSFSAQAADLAGCVKGPADLSTNPRHLDGFGR